MIPFLPRLTPVAYSGGGAGLLAVLRLAECHHGCDLKPIPKSNFTDVIFLHLMLPFL